MRLAPRAQDSSKSVLMELEKLACICDFVAFDLKRARLRKKLSE